VYSSFIRGGFEHCKTLRVSFCYSTSRDVSLVFAERFPVRYSCQRTIDIHDNWPEMIHGDRSPGCIESWDVCVVRISARKLQHGEFCGVDEKSNTETQAVSSKRRSKYGHIHRLASIVDTYETFVS
jgi:hypothetical protein